MVKNVGNLDALLRSLLAIALILSGLFLLDGIKGQIPGIIVATLSLIPIYIAITRKCIVFKLLNISSVSKTKK
jgi:hypothetical protein